MNAHNTLVDGRWNAPPDGQATITASDPTTGKQFDETYPITTSSELMVMAEAARKATDELMRMSPAVVSSFLDAYADLLEADKDRIVEMAHMETALPREPRLADVEFPRMIDQMRQGARHASDMSKASWRSPIIDQDKNIRSCLEPLGGAVFILGPNNFPLAFNAISGGDFCRRNSCRESGHCQGASPHIQARHCCLQSMPWKQYCRRDCRLRRYSSSFTANPKMGLQSSSMMVLLQLPLLEANLQA